MTDPAETTFLCPDCQQEFLVVPAENATLVECPNCHAQVVVAGLDGSTEVQPAAEEELRHDREDELDGLRIRQLSRGRRATIRSVSHTMIAAVVCGVSSLQCLWQAWRSLRRQKPVPAIGFIIFAIVLVIFMSDFIRRRRQLKRELTVQHDDPPGPPPDFTPLGDGSQTAKNLENLRL